MKRALLILALIIAALVGVGAGVANAAPARPAATPNLCADPPQIAIVGDSPLDKLDPGPDNPDPTTLYGRFGYSGWGVFGYDAGCWDKVKGYVAEQMPGLGGQAMKATTVNDSGPVKMGGFFVEASLALIALIAVAARIAWGQHPVWEMFDPISDTLRTVIGPSAILAWLSIGLALSGVWVLFKADVLSLAESSKRSSIAITVAAVGCALAVWQGTVGQATTEQATQVYASVDTVSATQGNRTYEDAGTAFATIAMEQLVLPGWGQAHLGNDTQSVQQWAPRLRSTTSLDRAESAQARNNPDQIPAMKKAKQDEFTKVAAELETADPIAYEAMGAMTWWRAFGPFVSFAGTFLCAVIVGFLLSVAILARFLIPFIVSSIPLVASAVQHPSLQGWAIGIARGIALLVGAFIAATVAFLVYIRLFVYALLADTGWTWGQRVGGFIVVSFMLILAWKNRSMIAQKVGAAPAIDQATRLRIAVEDGLRNGMRRAQAKDDADADTNTATATPVATATTSSNAPSTVTTTRPPRVSTTEQIDAQRATADADAEAETAAKTKPRVPHRTPRQVTGPIGDPFKSATSTAMRRFETMEGDELARRRAGGKSNHIRKGTVAAVSAVATPNTAKTIKKTATIMGTVGKKKP